MFEHRDFTPGVCRDDEGGFTLEGFPSVVAAARDWVAANQVRVVQFETVVLPNLYHHGEIGTQDTSLRVDGAADYYQFLRLWYQAD